MAKVSLLRAWWDSKQLLEAQTSKQVSTIAEMRRLKTILDMSVDYS